MPRADVITCTPDDLLANQPCLACLSTRELLAILALLLCKINGADPDADCSVETLASEAKCFNCMSDHQMLEAIVALVAQFAIDNDYLEADTGLRQDAECLVCADPKTVRSIILKQICDGINNGTILCVNLA